MLVALLHLPRRRQRGERGGDARGGPRDCTSREMMVTDFRTIPVHATLSQAAELLLAGEQREFPVVDNLGRTEGILTRDNLIRGLSRHGPESTVARP